MPEEAKPEAKKPAYKQKEQMEKAQHFQAPKKNVQIVRLAETDLDGSKTVAVGVRQVRGVSHMFANAIAKVSPLADKKILDLSEDEIKQIEDVIFNPGKYGIPFWLLNRRSDPDTGLDNHVAVSHLQLSQSTDINKMKKMRSYKGVRHSLGLPVRGQRTRSSFREKGKTIGVRRVKEQPAKAGAAQPPAKK